MFFLFNYILVFLNFFTFSTIGFNIQPLEEHIEEYLRKVKYTYWKFIAFEVEKKPFLYLVQIR